MKMINKRSTDTDTQIISDETSSTIPKTTTLNDQDSKTLSANEMNERDIKTAAASALAAAAVKAKVYRQKLLNLK